MCGADGNVARGMNDLQTVLLLALAFYGLIDVWRWRRERAGKFEEMMKEAR